MPQLPCRSWRWSCVWAFILVCLLVAPCVAIDSTVTKTASLPLESAKASPSEADPPKISASGRALLRQCEGSLKTGSSRRDLLPSTLTWLKWDTPQKLPPSKHHEDLGWAETSGMGVVMAKVNVMTCFLVAVKTMSGEPFDRGCLQRAALMSNLTSAPGQMKLHINTHPGEIRFSADVTYLPNLGMHNACYVAPNPGQYHLEVSLGFSNAFYIQTGRDPTQYLGFANYTPVVTSTVNVTGGKYFSLYLHRKRQLPPCTLDILTNAKNKGFWMGHTWMPQACRLRRLAPFTIMSWLNGKNILFLGDSEMRYLFGLFQVFLSMRSRSAFLQFLHNHPWHRGSKLEAVGVPGRAVPGPEPPREADSNMARHIPYLLSTGYSVYFGGRYSGFGHQRLRFRAIPRVGPRGPLGSGVDMDINVTYVSFFTPSDDLFDEWMVDGSVTGGFKAYQGKPYDMVIEGCLLHGVLEYDSALEYGKRLSSTFIPRLKKICPQPECTFASYGPLAGMEAWKPPRFVHMSNNLRNYAFEEEAYRVYRQRGFPNMLHISPVTMPIRGSELAADPAHFRAPVTLAMMDLLFGSLITNSTGPLV